MQNSIKMSKKKIEKICQEGPKGQKMENSENIRILEIKTSMVNIQVKKG